MSKSSTGTLTATCSCGSVEVSMSGSPIACLACYCDDCQAGAREIEALPNAALVQDANGGTEVVLYRKDRINCNKGAEHLKNYKLQDKSPTNRVVATCCNSAMYLSFDKGPYWVSVLRSRFRDGAPPLDMRIQTKFARENSHIPTDVPRYSSLPWSIVPKLVTTRIAMFFG